MKNRKRILVTGGAGFIGSHLCERLLKEGHDVVSLDNFFTGTKENILPLMENPYFESVRHDITHQYFIEVDWIFNLACPASPVHYQFNPIKTLKTNIMGTLNMLGLAKRVKARILHASTSEVYGDPEMHPQKEEYWGNVNPIGLRSCYDEGKRAAETLMMDYKREQKVDSKIVRIFNTYGPKMRFDDGRVVSNFIVQALKGDDITVYGDGSQTRSFCYVDDLVEAMMRMMKKDDFSGPVNTGNPDEFTVMELAQKIIEMTGSKSKIIFKELPSDDPVRRKPDISLAREKLDWEPKVKLEEGLKTTIGYFDQWLSA
ncbi:MAG: SDR family oxidoreductase [Proteobacteria bacterium]|nr:SDR family oxidoreductase [Pseudomonadota bacterium]